jgi:hypothetical protein
MRSIARRLTMRINQLFTIAPSSSVSIRFQAEMSASWTTSSPSAEERVSRTAYAFIIRP